MTLNGPLTLAGVLRQRASERPQHVVYRFLKDGETEAHQLTHATLDEQARAIGARLLALGVPGQPVLLLYGPGLDAIAALFGCFYAGRIAAPLSPPRPRQSLGPLAAAAADAQAAIVLTTRDWLARAWPQVEREPRLAQLHWLATDGPLPPAAPAEGWREPKPDDLAVLLYTSGSTNAPKGVLLTQRALRGAPLALPPGFDPRETVTGVNWMPLYHISGLNSVLLALRAASGAVVLLPPEAVLAEPARWLRAISRYRALHARGPNFLYQLCVDRVAPEDRAGLDLSRWFFARCSAEPVRAETLEQFIAAYASYGFRPAALLPAYGLSELPAVSGSTPGRAPALPAFDRAALAQQCVSPVAPGTPGALRLVGNGRPDPGVMVRIVDPDSARLCPAGAVGEIWVSSPYMAAGYWGKPEATRATFQARIAGADEGPFLRTGDLGFLYEGELYICGRLKDVIILRGQNYNALDVEAAASGSHPQLGPAAAAFGALIDGAEQLVVYHELRPECPAPDVPAISAAIRRAVAQVLQLPVYAVVLVPAGALPRTPVGKIRRFECRAAFMAQQLYA